MTAGNGTDRATAPGASAVVAAAVLGGIAALAAVWIGLRWADFGRMAEDVRASSDAGRLLGALAGFGAVALFGLVKLRAPRWALAAPGAAAIAIAWLAAEIGALGQASLGPTASFAQRGDALFAAAGIAGSLAGAGMLTASALLAVAALAVGVVPDGSGDAASTSRDAMPRWGVPTALGVLAVTFVLVGMMGRETVDFRIAVSAALPAAIALLAVALAERRAPDRHASIFAASLIGLGAVLAWALALAVMAAYELETGSVVPGMHAALARAVGFRRLTTAALFALAPAGIAAVAWWKRRPSPTAPALVVALFGAGALLAVGLRARSVIISIPDLAARQAALLAHPGEAVEDDAVAAGTLAVELVSGAASLELEEPAMVIASPGGRRVRWLPDGPAMFDGLAAEPLVELRVEGPYLTGSGHAAPPATRHGARVALLALPHDPPKPRPELGSAGYGKKLELDLTEPAKPRLRWREGPVAFVDIEMPRAATPDVLAAHFDDQWKQQGNHRHPMDRKFDEAVVIAPRGAPFADVLAVVSALEATEREVETGRGGSRRVPAFQLTVAEPPPQRKVSADESAARLAARAEAAPPEDRVARFTEALATCRAPTCAPALHGSLWRSLGSALASEGAGERAADAFYKALTIDPGTKLDDGAPEVAAHALAAARKRAAVGVLFGPHTVSGRSNPAVVQEALREADGAARLCFLLAPPPPAPSGAPPFELSVRLLIGRDGALYHRKSDALDPAGLEACVGRALERLRVAPPETGLTSIGYRMRAAPAGPPPTTR